jgi:hypothetical protein
MITRLNPVRRCPGPPIRWLGPHRDGCCRELDTIDILRPLGSGRSLTSSSRHARMCLTLPKCESFGDQGALVSGT